MIFAGVNGNRVGQSKCCDEAFPLTDGSIRYVQPLANQSPHTVSPRTCSLQTELTLLLFDIRLHEYHRSRLAVTGYKPDHSKAKHRKMIQRRALAACREWSSSTGANSPASRSCRFDGTIKKSRSMICKKDPRH